VEIKRILVEERKRTSPENRRITFGEYLIGANTTWEQEAKTANS